MLHEGGKEDTERLSCFRPDPNYQTLKGEKEAKKQVTNYSPTITKLLCTAVVP